MSQQKSKTSDTDKTIAALEKKVADLTAELKECQEAALRANADYQNLHRRTTEERQQLAKFAEQSLIEDLLQPLEHLDIAAQQLNDKGLLMVLEQMWKTLADHGLQQLQVLGQPYDVSTMEVTEIVDDVPEAEAVVVQVVRPGYMLHDKIIQHAKVVLGKAN